MLVLQEVRYKVRDPKAHSKGGTLENTLNAHAATSEDPLPTMHPLHPGKVSPRTTYGKRSDMFAADLTDLNITFQQLTAAHGIPFYFNLTLKPVVLGSYM